MTALSPFVVENVRNALGAGEPALSLPVWIAAPWKAGPNAAVLWGTLPCLFGCDPSAVATVVAAQGVDPPDVRWPGMAGWLMHQAPLIAGWVAVMVAVAVWRERSAWRRTFALTGDDVSPPGSLAATVLAVSLGLYLLQGTSPNGSSVRYLVPVWVALPGLLARGLTALPGRAAWPAALSLLVPWAAAQGCVWNDLDRPSPARALVAELDRRGVGAIVAPTPVALLAVDLSAGSVGALEYQPIWPRLGRRYAGRFAPGRPVVCVVDRGHEAEPARSLRLRLDRLSRSPGGRVAPAWRVGPFEAWEVDRPLSEILAAPDAERAERQ
jgi:hypothetical protein